MPTLEEALNGSVIGESTVVGGINDRLIIDIESREIHIPESELLLGVESDEKGERKYFEIPRYVGNNLDLWELGLRVVYYYAQGKVGMYVVTDKQLEGDKITFSWELYRSVTEYKGNVEFLVCAVKAQADGTYAILTRVSGDKSGLDVYEWSSENGGNVNQWEFWGGACQKWVLEKTN